MCFQIHLTCGPFGVKLTRLKKLCIVIICAVCIWFVYTYWPSSSFTNYSKKLYKEETNGNVVSGFESESRNAKGRSREVKIQQEHEEMLTESVDFIPVVITFTNAKHNFQLQEKFRVTIKSMLKFSTVGIHFHIIGEEESQKIAEKTIVEASEFHKNSKYKMAHLNVEKLAKDLHEIVKEMQEHFSYKPGAYYSDALFFLSIAIHRVMPTSMHKIIMLDADLKFNADIRELYQLFSEFQTSDVIGIARENQPVYRHTFSLYRSKNPGTRVGEPPPNGLTGFNSGVLLLHLDRMRKSDLYNSVINPNVVRNLTQKYNFKGHLGDQDLFTLLSMEHEELFYFLPCGWNRQLCRWWEDKGYQNVFSSYFECQGHISIYHGNCNTPIPKLDWES